ncbi:MAG: hypothetical protein IT567_03110 [Alphaproteobacteria bacterium]|nr:hypothetical protein [Alphaproteobacteria bacterium]
MNINRKTVGGFGIGLLALGLVMRFVLPVEAPTPMVWVANAIPVIGFALALVSFGLWSSEKSPAVATFIGLCLSAIGALYFVVGISGGGWGVFVGSGLLCLLGLTMVGGYFLRKR